MKTKTTMMHIRVPVMVRDDLKNLSNFRHASMNTLIIHAIIEKLERERRTFLNNTIPKE